MKSGDVVEHKSYGTGKVLELRRAGLEAKVKFYSGFVMICPVRDISLIRPLDGGSPAVKSQTVSFTAPSPVETIKPLTKQPSALKPVVQHKAATVTKLNGDERFLSRQTIEALRLGVVPQMKVDELTVGLLRERADVRNALLAVEERGGDARAVIGEYGSGKSHLFEWTAHEALKRGFLVARTNLDVLEVQPNRPQRIYTALIRSLRYPDRTDGGSVGPLFDQLIEGYAHADVVKTMADMHEKCPLLDALYLYGQCKRRHDAHGAAVMLDWIGGEKLFAPQVKAAAQASYTRISVNMNAADQYCYLLSGIGWLARQAGYKGLVVLIDEAEHYRLLSYSYKYYAETFFKGMIYSVLGDRQYKIKGCGSVHGFNCGLSHGSNVRYPFRYAEDCNVLFMFAATPASRAPEYVSWLERAKIIYLEDKLSEGEIESLLAQIYVFHRKAFSYDRREDYVEAGTKLVGCYEAGLINLRELIRLSTEVFDLLRWHPDYDYACINKEIEHAFAGRASQDQSIA